MDEVSGERAGRLARARGALAKLAQRSRLGWVVAGLMTVATGAFAYVAFSSPASGDQAPSAAPATTVPPTTGGPQAAPVARARAVVGRVTALSTAGFSLTTAAGRAVQVQVGPATLYGTPAHPQAQGQVQVGSRVRVVGRRSGSTVVARRVVVLPAVPAQAPQPPAPPPSA
ncbi:MAG TPA: hypothetical protein VKY15_03810 [Acidimicrobiales bacterium]|nr:hypothetical protein [Acidimicrobiales bacterium]